MLGKLIKNEFKTTWQSMSGIYLAAGITALTMLIFVVLKIKAITAIGSIALLVIAAVSLVMTIIMVVTNYYRSMFGPQGYLTFTLPVKSSNLFFSKALVSFIWVLLSFVFVGAILAFLFFYLIAQTSASVKDLAKTLYSFVQQIKGIPDFDTVKYLMVLLVVIGFIGLLAFVCKVYFAMTLAHTKLFQKMSAPLASIIVYFILYLISQLVNVFCMTSVPIAIVVSGNSVYLSLTRGMLESIANISPNYIPFPIGGYIFTILFSVVLYFVTSYLIKNKVNVK